MRRVVVLEEAAEDLEAARSFYDASEAGVGEHCVSSLQADIASLALFHRIHWQQHGCFRMLSKRFPFGIYYLEAPDETQVVAGWTCGDTRIGFAGNCGAGAKQRRMWVHSKSILPRQRLECVRLAGACESPTAP